MHRLGMSSHCDHRTGLHNSGGTSPGRSVERQPSLLDLCRRHRYYPLLQLDGARLGSERWCNLHSGQQLIQVERDSWPAPSCSKTNAFHPTGLSPDGSLLSTSPQKVLNILPHPPVPQPGRVGGPPQGSPRDLGFLGIGRNRFPRTTQRSLLPVHPPGPVGEAQLPGSQSAGGSVLC